MKRKSSYQKLKDHTKRLQYDIQALRGKHGRFAQIEVELRYNVGDQLEEALWFGTVTIGKKVNE